MFLLTAALAASPTVTADAHVVRADLRVDAPADAVLALLADPTQVALLSPDVRSARTTVAGACDNVVYRTAGLLAPYELTVERCATDGGWTEHLVASEVYTAWDVAWTVAEEADGTHVRVVARVDLWTLPGVFVQPRVVRSLTVQLEKLSALLDG